jgi:hypothetical protein
MAAAAPAPDGASLRPLFQRLCARGATAGSKAAALAELKARLDPKTPEDIAPAAALALDEGALDALVEVLLGAPSTAGRPARLLIGRLSLASAAFSARWCSTPVRWQPWCSSSSGLTAASRARQ